MSRGKLAVGLFVLVGFPIAFALIFSGLGYGYDHQHVHNVWAVLQGGRAVVRSSDYHHSGAGVTAVAGVLALVWVGITALFVLAGSKMIASRNREWLA